jgi:hypothetical protein
MDMNLINVGMGCGLLGLGVVGWVLHLKARSSEEHLALVRDMVEREATVDDVAKKAGDATSPFFVPIRNLNIGRDNPHVYRGKKLTRGFFAGGRAVQIIITPEGGAKIVQGVIYPARQDEERRPAV